MRAQFFATCMSTACFCDVVASLPARVRVTLNKAKSKRGGNELSTDEQNMASGLGKVLDF